MKSHAILRTNVGLTTNVKLMVGTTYSLYLDSIESSSELADTRYKKMQFNKDNYWDELVPYFFKNTPIDLAYQVKYDDDNDNMATDFSQQFDDLYNYGARNIINNKDYDEDYEYFAPLYINKDKLPKYFIIFRIDGPGLLQLTKENFHSEIINKLKSIKLFDLTRKSDLGVWLENNITKNKLFPITPFYMDFRKMEFSSWFGLDYEDGGYSEKAFMLDSTLDYENTFHDLEKFIYDGFKNNKVIFPHIINFSFLFSDTPATPTSLRKWSLNRYLGFYLDDMELEFNVSPYILPKVKDDVIIDVNNILYSRSSETPFDETLNQVDFPFIEVNGNFYKVERYIELQLPTVSRIQTSSVSYEDISSQPEVIKYKILSDINLSGRQSEINKNLILIDSSSGRNKLTYYDGSTFNIPRFDDADVWLINIGDKFHNIIKGDDNEYYINTDYAFLQSVNRFDYYINDPDPNFRTSINLEITSDTKPLTFSIFKCKFSDIKDFDTDIVETEFSKHEYIKKNQLTLTDEPKMFTVNYESTAYPKDLNDYKINGEVTNIPVASEYTANGETFRLQDNQLSTLWRKNPVRVKSGLQGSNSSADYPYLLNNSFIAEDYNRTSNVHAVIPSRQDRNLDHFLTINSSSIEYTHHSLHVEDHLIDSEGNVTINTDFKFELDKYLGVNNSEFDYFTYFFGKKTYLDSGSQIKNVTKWSYFTPGDNTIPNLTLFKGIKYKIYDVNGIKIDNGTITKINIKTSNSYSGWKFAVLFSKNEYSVLSSENDINLAQVIRTDNSLKWKTIDVWKRDKIYYSGTQSDVVVYNGSLWIANTQSQIIDPNINPSNSNDWSLFTQNSGQTFSSVFWSPLVDGTNATYSNNMYNQGFPANLPPLVYNSGEWYFSSGSTGSNFWISNYSYATSSVVLYQNQVYQSIIGSNTSVPGTDDSWIKSNNSTIWSVVELWTNDKIYDINSSSFNTTYFDPGFYVIYNNVVYATTQSIPSSQVPSIDNRWFRVYSMSPDTDYVYGPSMSSNNIFQLNNSYYWCLDNTPGTASDVNYDQTLDDGIVIYVNKKWQNVLVNIYVNDNTLTKISNVDRDDLYTDLYSKLTAHNISQCINDLSNKYGFSDSIRYVVINQDSTINIYDFNDLNSISSLPVLLRCEEPDEVLSRIQSLDIKPISLEPSEIKADKVLKNGNISTLEQLNYYSDIHLATSIEKRTDDSQVIPNYSGLQNNIYSSMWRHSGPYTPIFHDIDLFESLSENRSLIGNYKFDTSLSNFGMIKERISSKVNRTENILKLKNKANLKSIFPMLDEFGYHTSDFYIFKSTFDIEYHIECIKSPEINSSVIVNKITGTNLAASITLRETINQSLSVIRPDNGTNTNNLELL